ncbi:cbb3-type cytochrome oxidase subunit 3 [Haloferula sp.]|uniref:cbb3-type cytochrome oxidase subunit 3 n=1 Tax=Haloferula sp. TaxID=2497595 RepID=UPI003C76D90B
MDLTIYHWLLIVLAFFGIVIWVFSKKRKARFERDSRIPFDDDDEDGKNKD